MSVTTDTNKIIFTHTVADIFDRVQHLTTRIAQGIVNEKTGVPLTDMYAVTEDEKNTVILLLKEAARNIFKNFSKLTFGIANAITISETEVKLTIKDNGSNNENGAAEIDDLMEQALTTYIVAAWFAKKGLGNLSNANYVEYNNLDREISDKSFRLRIPA